MTSSVTKAIPRAVRRVGFQVISYDELIEGKLTDSISSRFTHSFGQNGLGGVIVRDIPDLLKHRSSLTNLSTLLANQPEAQLQALSGKSSISQRGWSTMNGKIYGVPERTVGEFLAHISPNDKYRFRTTQMETLPRRVLNLVGDNIWPPQNELKQFSNRFLAYHSLVKRTGLLLLNILEKHIESKQPYFRTKALSQLLKRSDEHVGGLTFFYPDATYEQLAADKDRWHIFSGLIQGISQFIYQDNQGNELLSYPDQESGVHAFAGDLTSAYTRLKIDENSVLFTAGEALSILSGGVVCTKPIQIVRGNSIAGKDVSVEIEMTSIQPGIEEKLQLPVGVKTPQFFDTQLEHNELLNPLSCRWTPFMSYGEFLEKTIILNKQ